MSRVLRSFREMIGLLSRGDYSNHCDQLMTEAIDALDACPADKCKAEITLKITLEYELGRIDVKAEAIAGQDAPRVPGCNSIGRLMIDLQSHECRFPLQGSGAAMRFCAVEVSPADWLPGFSMGSYCQFHRTWLRRQAADDEVAE